jgi:hypothetical protein
MLLHFFNDRTIVIGNPRRLSPTSRRFVLKELVKVHPWVLVIMKPIEEISSVMNNLILEKDRFFHRVARNAKRPESRSQLIRQRWQRCIEACIEMRCSWLRYVNRQIQFLSKIVGLLVGMKDVWKQHVVKKIVGECRCFLSTIDSAHHINDAFYVGRRPLFTVIVDEAGCVPEFSMPLLLQLHPTNMLLVGDTKQLRPFSRVPEEDDVRLHHSRSLLERAELCRLPLHLLPLQYIC